ncbi:MAG: SpoIID/LytB domain-containing protein [Phycisphaerales bacterium]
MDRQRLGVAWFSIALVFACVCGCETVDGIARDIGVDERVPPLKFAAEPDVRIRVSREQTRCTIAGNGPIVVRIAGASSGDLVSGPIEVTGSTSGLSLADGAGRRKTFSPGIALEFLAANPLNADSARSALASESLVLNGTKYPGFLVLRPAPERPSGAFDIVVDMPVESYIPGVLTHELFPSWPRQTFEAQAVASRTYALHERERARSTGRPFDLEASDADQVFGGQAGSIKATEATRATRGRVATYNGRLIRAYFSSQCGGRPASARWAWSGETEYAFNQAKPLQGSKRRAFCQQSPLYRWNVTRSDDDFTQRLRAYGRSIKADFGTLQRVRKVEITDRNDAGRPNRYTVTDASNNTFELSPEQIRVGANYPASSLAPVTKENRVNSGDVEVEVWANQVRFQGRGWGHGVGMCQYCAKGMAEQGMDWPGMIAEFYPGAVVTKAYE